MTDQTSGRSAADRFGEPPETGDLVVDAALAAVASASDGSLDDRLVAGEELQRTLHARLTDLGG